MLYVLYVYIYILFSILFYVDKKLCIHHIDICNKNSRYKNLQRIMSLFLAIHFTFIAPGDKETITQRNFW